MKKIELISIFILFIVSRIWLYLFSGNPVGVDSVDYMTYVRRSTLLHSLQYAPLHVPGFYGLLSCISVFSGIDVFELYSFYFPLILSIALFLVLKDISKNNPYVLILGGTLGFFTLRSTLIIPEALGILLIPIFIGFLMTIGDLQEQEKRENLSLVEKILLYILGTSIILSHHLSGGIFLVIYLYYTIRRNKLEYYEFGIIFIIEAIIAWSMAESFPIRLLILFILDSKFIIGFFLISMLFYFAILKFDKFKQIRKSVLNLKASLEYKFKVRKNSLLKLSVILVLPLLIFIGILTGLSVNDIIYWFPNYVIIIFVSYYLFSNTSERRYPILNSWIYSILLLMIGISLFSNIRPLLSRIFVFSIESGLLYAAIGFSIVVEDIISQKKSKKIISSLIIALLLLNLFQTYPVPQRWFNTEFRYYDQEIHSAIYLDVFHNNNRTIDTDNRLGVLIRGLTTLNSTDGQIGQSWLTNNLINNPQSNLNSITNYIFLISQVILRIGYLKGKFIQGQGGGAQNVYLHFQLNLLNFISSHSSKVFSNDFCFIFIPNETIH